MPSGYSFNLDGTNIYLTMAALFVAQALNIELTLRQQLTLLGVAMLTSKGASGVTGAGFITLAATLAVVPSIPVAGLALILGVDRFMSEARSITNFIGNGVAAIVVSRWERELDTVTLRASCRPATGLSNLTKKLGSDPAKKSRVGRVTPALEGRLSRLAVMSTPVTTTIPQTIAKPNITTLMSRHGVVCRISIALARPMT